jgi:hypothetical protein
MRPTLLILPICITTASLVSACAPKDSSVPAVNADSTNAVQSTASAAQAGPSDISPVRGALVSANDSALVVATSKGDVHVVVAPPLHAYKSEKGELSKVTDHSFIGVTSVAQADDTQLATEIHVFPEELRGTGEGSYLMTAPAGSTKRSTMTNGAVATSPTAKPSRMTNGTIAGKGGSTLTVDYKGGSRVITVPRDVPVTEIVPTQDKLSPGTNVIVLAVKQPDGTLKASRVMFMRKP